MCLWIRQSSGYPVYQMRFHKLGEARFVQVGHGQRETEVKREVGKLHEPYIHDAFSKGLDDWFERHNRYSRDEARQALRDMRDGVVWSALAGADAVARRRALKQLAWRLPGRAWFRFLYQYLLKCGFLDGVAGYRYCRLLSVYEQMITLKINELKSSVTSDDELNTRSSETPVGDSVESALEKE